MFIFANNVTVQLGKNNYYNNIFFKANFQFLEKFRITFLLVASMNVLNIWNNAKPPAEIHLFKVNSGNTKAMYEICLKFSDKDTRIFKSDKIVNTSQDSSNNLKKCIKGFFGS